MDSYWNMSLESTGGLALWDFSKSVAPGWRPGMLDYPFRLFLLRLTLWLRITDVEETVSGPLVAARLQGLGNVRAQG